MDSIPPAMWERSRRLARVSPRILAIVAVGLVLNFLVFASGAMAAQTYQVKVGGVAVGAPLAQGGVVWFNGYDPSLGQGRRSEEHTSELQSHSDLVCRLLLEKKKKK